MAIVQTLYHVIGPVINMVSSPVLFAVFACLVLTMFTWPVRWILSGAPLLQFLILLGDSNGLRVLPWLNVWPMFTTLHFVYAISSTSWLLYWVFTFICYPTIALVCLFQFDWAANHARDYMRRLVAGLHFIDDKIAFFDIPALEIDHEVDGLLVVRGLTFSLSTFSFVVHGIEVGIKLTDDIELAIQCEEVKVQLFRRCDVGHCFMNLKGGKFEMTFGSLPKDSTDANGEPVLLTGDTDILRAAAKKGDSRRPEMVKMTSQFTGGSSPESSTAKEGLKAMLRLSASEGDASQNYRKRLHFIQQTNAIREAREKIIKSDPLVEEDNETKILAAICSALHSTPSVPHPPELGVKITTIKKMSNPKTKHFIHRLPLLLRLLLNPICYFHPVWIEGITASASGRWIDTLLVSEIFKSYGEQDKEIASLRTRISAWLSNANFVVELSGIKGLAQVPINFNYDIISNLVFDDVLAYRSIPRPDTEFNDLTRVLHLAGADLTVTLPTFLLPRHDHLLPPQPTELDTTILAEAIRSADSLPDLINAKNDLHAAIADCYNLKVAAHVKLPAVLNQDLLDFTAVLVKASKIVELEKELEAANSPTPSQPGSPALTPVSSRSAMSDETGSISSILSEADSEISHFSDRDDGDEKTLTGRSRKRSATFGNKINGKIKGGLKVGMKRMMVDTVVNEKWVSKLVGKVMRKMEKAKGEIGYAADIPMPLKYYRDKAIGEAEKILP